MPPDSAGAHSPMCPLGEGLSTTPASHRFSVFRNLLPGWKRCLRLLETECFLLWGWFLQGSGEQRAEDAAAQDEELNQHGMPSLCQGLHAQAVSLLCSSMGETYSWYHLSPLDHTTTLDALLTSGQILHALTVANAVLVDSLHLPQQMVQSFSLSPSPWGPAIVLPPVCGGHTSITPWSGGKRGSHALLSKVHHLPAWHSMAWHQTWVLGISGQALGDSQEHPASAQHPMATLQHGRDTAQGRNKVPSVAAPLCWT